MSESMDIKRFVLVSKKRIWKIFAVALICAAVFCVVCLLCTYVFAGSFPYRSSALYYIDYDQYVDFASDNPNNQPFSSITHTTVK